MHIAILILATASPLDPLSARLSASAFLEADFVQTDYWALTRDEEISSGHISLASPDLFRLDYEDPAGRIVGCDGETVYTVEPASREVLLSGGEGSSLLAFLDLDSDPSLVESVSESGDTVTVVLAGDLGDGITGMTVEFTSSDSLPRSLCTTDSNGNRTTWVLGSPTTRRTVPGGRFALSVPEGFSVVRPGDV
jgi:outer membrane lipoprotein-sorting protein